MEYECAVISFLYIERVIRRSKGAFSLDHTNWKAMVMACIVMTNKVWDDFHMDNKDYCDIIVGVHITRVNALEAQLLRVLNADLWVGTSEYASYHFRVQEMFAKAEVDKMKIRSRRSFSTQKTPRKVAPAPNESSLDHTLEQNILHEIASDDGNAHTHEQAVVLRRSAESPETSLQPTQMQVGCWAMFRSLFKNK
jgi:hypothetical protein